MPSRGPARSGRRNPALLEPAEPAPATGLIPVYVACRPLPMGDYLIPEGTEVPGAGDWPRVEAWVNARRIRQLHDGEEYQTYEAFVAEEDERLAAEEAEREQQLVELEAAEQAQEPAPQQE